MVRTQRYPPNYYEAYPYGQSYVEDYFYPEESIPYPPYYPARTSTYEVYQAVLPYYYNDRPMVRPSYYSYEDPDPILDLEDEMVQEPGRDEREESQPIGQEMYYENEPTSEENFEDVNAAFLQNLIRSQLYGVGFPQKEYYPHRRDWNTDRDDQYGTWENYPVEKQQNHHREDQEVKELRQLVNSRKHSKQQKKIKSKKPRDEEHWFQRSAIRHTNERADDEQASNIWENKRDVYKYSNVEENEKSAANNNNATADAATTSEPSPTESSNRFARGQKEEVLIRPAAPVRHPFPQPVLSVLSNNELDKKRKPSVYDTIKHMLDMEKKLEHVSQLYVTILLLFTQYKISILQHNNLPF